jgi:hypothetical protein
MPDFSRLKQNDLEALKAALMVILDNQSWVLNERERLSCEADYSANIVVKKTKQLLAGVNGQLAEIRATFGETVETTDRITMTA